MGRLSGRAVIVTGGAQGIGAAYAKALAEDGARIAVCDITSPENTAAIIRQSGGEAIAMVCDVTDAASVQRLVESTVEAFGGVQGLVNNAALFATLPRVPFEQIKSADFDRVMGVNVRGAFECIKAVTPVMRRQKYGKIVNVASGTVFKGTPLMASYVASKGAVVAMTRAIAREVGNDGICINCIAPGLTMSEGVKNSDVWTESVTNATMVTRAIRREQVPEDLTGTVAFLLSADSDFMTGQTVVVDGGAVMH